MRYFTQTGSCPKIAAAIHIAGPQDESQIMPEIKAILDKPGIQEVIVLYDHGLGERIGMFRKMKDEL